MAQNCNVDINTGNINTNIITYITSKISILENKRISRIGNFDANHFVDSANNYYQKISNDYEKKKNNFQQSIGNSMSEMRRLAIVDNVDTNNLQEQLSLTNRIANMNLRPFKNLVKSYNNFIPAQTKYEEMTKLMKLVNFYQTTESIMEDNKNYGITINIPDFIIDPIALYLPVI